MEWSQLKYRSIWLPILCFLTIACWDTLCYHRTSVSHVGVIVKATLKTTAHTISQSSLHLSLKWWGKGPGSSKLLWVADATPKAWKKLLKVIQYFLYCIIPYYAIPFHPIPSHLIQSHPILSNTCLFVSLEILAKMLKKDKR